VARYLVTGGAGFFGSNMVEMLLHEGEEVRVLDNFSSGRKENLEQFGSDIELVAADIKDLPSVRKAVNDIDYIMHVAAQRSVPHSIDAPVGCNDNNVNGTLNILLAAKDAGVKRVVFASSSSVYGNQEVFPQAETLPACPISPYAVSKLVGEYYCNVFYTVYGLETVSMRYFNIFGPRQDPTSEYANVIPLFINLALANMSVEVHGDGLQSRDFTYVSDAARATLLAAKAPMAPGHSFNVGNGDTFSIMDIVRERGEISGKPLQFSHTEAREGAPRRTQADTSKAKELLGYTAAVSFKEGLQDTWDWFSAKVAA
jgi:nucleoside-diphosphate-sugar epimerase